MKISKKELKAFERIIERYKGSTEIPKKHDWKTMDNNDLWLRIVSQINVVGGVEGNDRFWENNDLVKRISLNALKKTKTDKELSSTINSVLREAAIRYVSADIENCNKTKSLVHNYKFIENQKGGLRGILLSLSAIKGKAAELERVSFFTDSKNFMYLKNKSARDLLMGLGMNRNTLAIDIRIQNIFSLHGITLPDQKGLNNKQIYAETENEIIEKICRPLSIEPIIFDRILFQNYDSILK
jgi:hypothetical protein